MKVRWCHFHWWVALGNIRFIDTFARITSSEGVKWDRGMSQSRGDLVPKPCEIHKRIPVTYAEFYHWERPARPEGRGVRRTGDGVSSEVYSSLVFHFTIADCTVRRMWNVKRASFLLRFGAFALGPNFTGIGSSPAKMLIPSTGSWLRYNFAAGNFAADF